MRPLYFCSCNKYEPLSFRGAQRRGICCQPGYCCCGELDGELGLELPYPPAGDVGLFCIGEGEFENPVPIPLLFCPEEFCPFKFVIPCIAIACCSDGWYGVAIN